MTLHHPTVEPTAAPEDLEGIRRTALDYIEGWYDGDVERMEHALHPDLVKRTPFADPRGFDRLEPISALAMVIATRRGVGRRTPREALQNDVTIHAADGPIASATVISAEFIDYLHLAKLNGQWQIINVLWKRRAVNNAG